ncbi:MAG: F0F1 ATP synthase subunit B [Patescibacteria group bacterium]
MSELFSNLGINGKLLFVQAVNFLIILFLLNKFVFPKVLGFIEQRKKRIEEGLELTERAKHEMQRIEEARHRELEKARKEADVLLNQAKTEAQEKEHAMVAEAKNRAEEIAQRAKEDAARTKVDALKEAKGEISKAALFFAEKVLARNMVKEDEERLAKEVGEELQKV